MAKTWLLRLKKVSFAGGIMAFSGLQFLLLSKEDNHLLDAASSLLPYWIVLSFSLILVLLFVYSKKAINFPFPVFAMLIVIMVIAMFGLGKRFVSFSYAASGEESGGKQVRIAFFNKLYSNTKYGEITKTIDRVNPELIGFAEMKSVDIGQITALKDYPYHFSKKARDGATISFFSRYPTTINTDFNSQFVLPLDLSMNGKTYKVFVIHPYPPISAGCTRERNNEILRVGTYIASLKEDQAILMGDFNMSPWSFAYQKTAGSIKTLKNSAEGKGMQLTWRGGPIATQIDHIFVPNNAKVESFTSVRVKGSDHNLIWIKVDL